MMKKKMFLSALTVALFSLLAVSCSKSDSDSAGTKGPSVALLNVTPEGVTTHLLNNLCPVFAATDPLTADEIEFLFAMREDEKMARDLYTHYAASFPQTIPFSRIALAEANHMAAVERLLDYYEIDYPALGAVGQFVDPVQQARYETLLQASTPLEALKSMALLEEETIAAYGAVTKNATNSNIKILLENMVRASSNHLRAAVRQILLLGELYTPAVLDQNQFDELMAQGFQKGNQYHQQYGKGGKHHSQTNAQKCGNPQGPKGSVNGSGTCTGTTNAATGSQNQGYGCMGKGYRGGR